MSTADGTTSLKMHVVVVVLGDVGRSPRMQYHTLSLLQEGHVVSLIGYKGEALLPELQDKKPSQLQVIRFEVPKLPPLLERSLLFYFFWRILALTCSLIWAFGQVYTPTTTTTNNNTPTSSSNRTSDGQQRNPYVHCVLVQNPPALPLLWVAHWYCRIQGWRQRQQHQQQRLRGTGQRATTTTSPNIKTPALIIDWHNLGFSMLAKKGILTRILRRYEQWMAPKAQGHLCVTRIMKEFVQQDMLRGGVANSSSNIQVLYDCPPPFFRPLSSTDEQHELMSRLQSKLCAASPKSWYDALGDFQTLFTERRPIHTNDDTTTNSSSTTNESHYQARRGRPALIMSSTSWTPDEDFNVLLEALLLLDERITMQQSALKVMVVVTGKGPLRSTYQERIAKLPFRHVAITTLWLEMNDYPKLIACADLTISLHTSTSGLDLPMKLLDSFGCHVPALAYKYEALVVEPLLKHDVHGCLFQHHVELAEQLFWLLQPLAKAPYIQQSTPPHAFGELDRYSKALAQRFGDSRQRWHENWNTHALPVLLQAVFGTTAVEESADTTPTSDSAQEPPATAEAKKTK